jgi:protein SCO1/2
MLIGVGVEEHVGMKLPLDLGFTEASGRRIQLASVFDRKPVLLVLAYTRCKMLCSLVLRATTDAVQKMSLEPGRDYRLVTVSIDPDEDSATGLSKVRELLARIGRPGQLDRWTYLVGAEHPIHALADRLGFHYTWDPHTEQFAHPAVVFVLTPDGTIARYFQGIPLQPKELERALRSAANGELSSQSIAESVLSCFHFDPAARAHREAIDRYLQIGGAVICLLVGSLVASLVLWDRRRRPS